MLGSRFGSALEASVAAPFFLFDFLPNTLSWIVGGHCGERLHFLLLSYYIISSHAFTSYRYTQRCLGLFALAWVGRSVNLRMTMYEAGYDMRSRIMNS